jgi:hypothetical protein
LNSYIRRRISLEDESANFSYRSSLVPSGQWVLLEK